ncbi:SpoIIE family protein phosphatase [Streptomyces sp. NBS 14/10]|uniref:SpoIIE family protein phosphatase n=1 Tax=Streptomyces sp. NBS 14/10 TaxID=1945643 RepID=UPI00211B27BD|nr:SpoIIE family protein phosphatase [Streptomyces sp. NBS 14/10]KAK1181854.1 SpoIIE family protein phosphatase [Streptomyces sp. NBS 14/10]
MSEKPAGADMPEEAVGSQMSPKSRTSSSSRSPIAPALPSSSPSSSSVSNSSSLPVPYRSPESSLSSAPSVWQSSPPGSIYDYIRVASFSLGPDGRIAQWSRRATELLGLSHEEAIGKDPVEAFVPPELREASRRTVADILDGREWTGLVPYYNPQAPQAHGIAEVYVMPAETEHGERSALCIAVDVTALRGLETDLAASQAVFGQSPLGFFLFGTDLRMLRVNERFATVFGRPAEAYRGASAYDLLPRGEADRLAAALRQVLDSGQSLTDMPIVGTVPGNPERRRWSISLYRLHSGSGRPIGVAGLATDVTGRRRAEQEAAGVRRNLALLNEAGARIGTSLDLETTARELLDVAVPQFCDLASVDLYQGLLVGDETPSGLADGSAELRRVAFASAVSAGPVGFGDSYLSGSGASGDGAGGATKPVQVGEVHRYPFNSPSAVALRTARARVVPGRDGGESLEMGTMLQSTLVVPMVARDTVVGLAQFSRTKGSEPFGERDTALAVELAARAAVSIDNARLYRREHERALILQRSLLPPGDPEAAGLDIACRYLPGNAATEVGGDWFDVIELPGHRTALVVGDVMGRGLRAAVAMGELRTAVRTLALLDLEPAEVLSALDEIAAGLGAPGGSHAGGRAGSRALARGKAADGSSDLAEVYLATCVYAVYDPVTRRCTFANAGHPPPVLVEPGESALLMEVPPGMPLGVGGEPFEEIEVELPDGALLALYTDGLVESRDHTLDEGLQALRASLNTPDSVVSLEDVCDHVLSTLDTHHGEDDIALLMARMQGMSADAVGDWQLPSEPKSVGRARELARQQLESWGMDELVDTTELLVSELVTNALRYGEGEIRLRLLLDRTLVCEVWDSGLVQPRRRRARDTDEGGRGLQLVGLLSAGWGSRRTPHGKTVWFELALPNGQSSGPDSVEALLSMW